MIPIGNNIRIARKKKGFSEEYMAKKLSISADHYNLLESEDQNSLTWGQILEITSLLGINVESLLLTKDSEFELKIVSKETGEYSPEPFELTELRDLVRIQKELLSALKNNTDVKILL